MAEALTRGSRITGTQRAELAVVLGQRYSAGESIRAIAEDTGRSFGFVHGLVKESGVVLRGRGGATRGPAAKAAAARGRVAAGKALPAAPAAEAAPPGTGHEKGAKAEPKPKLSGAKAGAKDKPKARDRDRDKDKDKKSGKKGKR